MKYKYLLFLFACLLSATGFSQLDSLHVSTELTDSEDSETGHLLHFQVSANDLGEIGAFSIVIYNSVTEDVMAVRVYTAEQIAETEGLIQDGKIQFFMGEVVTNGTYTITVDFQNLQMAYLPQVVLHYPTI